MNSEQKNDERNTEQTRILWVRLHRGYIEFTPELQLYLRKDCLTVILKGNCSSSEGNKITFRVHQRTFRLHFSYEYNTDHLYFIVILLI